MSDIKWSTVECKGISGGGEAGFAAITDGIASAFGLSFEKSETTSKYNYRFYKLRSLTNCYIAFTEGANYINGAECYYKLKNGNFAKFGNIYTRSGPWCTLTETAGVKCKRTEFGGYNFRVIQDLTQANDYAGFTTGKFTDYFSKKTYDVLICAGNSGFLAYYLYDEENDNYSSLNIIPVGGSNYPITTQNIAVATPIMFGNTKHYGYIGNQSSLYELYGNYTRPGPITAFELGMQATINGTSFRQIGRTGNMSYFIRSS